MSLILRSPPQAGVSKDEAGRESCAVANRGDGYYQFHHILEPSL